MVSVKCHLAVLALAYQTKGPVDLLLIRSFIVNEQINSIKQLTTVMYCYILFTTPRGRRSKRWGRRRIDITF